MNVLDFLNNEYREVVREFNSSYDICYTTPTDLNGKKKFLEYMKLDLEDLGNYFGLYDRICKLICNINVVLNL